MNECRCGSCPCALAGPRFPNDAIGSRPAWPLCCPLCGFRQTPSCGAPPPPASQPRVRKREHLFHGCGRKYPRLVLIGFDEVLWAILEAAAVTRKNEAHRPGWVPCPGLDLGLGVGSAGGMCTECVGTVSPRSTGEPTEEGRADPGQAGASTSQLWKSMEVTPCIICSPTSFCFCSRH